jgi:hypothetical protein
LITVSRQPLFPDSTKEAVDLAEMMDGGGHSKQRRENFAKTAQSKFFFPIRYMYVLPLFCTTNKYAVTLMFYVLQTNISVITLGSDKFNLLSDD